MIVIVTRTFPPGLEGVEDLMAGLAQALADVGLAVTVLADGPEEPTDAGQPYTIRRFAGWSVMRTRSRARALAAMVQGGDVKAIFCDGWQSLEIVPRQLGAAVVCFAHGPELPDATPAKGDARIKAALARAQVIVASSDFAAARVEPLRPGGVPLRIITPPIPAQPPVDEGARSALRERLGDGPLVATICQLEPHRGVDRSIAALEWIIRQNRHARLVIAGEGDDRARLGAFAGECGVEQRVVFLGEIDSATEAALFDRADVFVMPARREGGRVETFGGVYLRAGFYGTPSVAGREGGAGDAVLHGETGYVVDGRDPMAVAEATAALLLDERLNLRCGIAARNRALAHLWPQRVRLYLEAAGLAKTPIEAA